MAAFTGIGGTLAAIAGAVGVAGTVAGTFIQYQGAQKAADAQEKAERLRQKQLELESRRQNRQILRQAAVARGLALTAGASQGASGGSGVAGGLAQIGTGAAENVSAVNDAESIGSGIFRENARAAQGQSMASVGSGLSSLGGTLIANQQAIGRLGGFAGGGGTVGAPMDLRPGWAT